MKWSIGTRLVLALLLILLIADVLLAIAILEALKSR